MTEQADERDKNRLEKTKVEKDKLQNQLDRLSNRRSRSTGSATALRLTSEITHLEVQIRNANTDLEQIQERIDERHGNVQEAEPKQEEGGNRKLPNESQRDFLIRTGKITPFSKMPGRSIGRSDSNLQEVLLGAEEDEEEAGTVAELESSGPREVLSHRNLVRPGFKDIDAINRGSDESSDSDRPKKRRRLRKKSVVEDSLEVEHDIVSGPRKLEDHVSVEDDATYVPGDGAETAVTADSTEDNSDDEYDDGTMQATTPLRSAQRSGRNQNGPRASQQEDLTGLDDGNERLYQSRLHSWAERRSTARAKALLRSSISINEEINEDQTDDDAANAETKDDEWHLPHPTIADNIYENEFRIPGDIYPSLFDYQKTGVQWLWELYSQQVGGIVGKQQLCATNPEIDSVQVMRWDSAKQYRSSPSWLVSIIAKRLQSQSS